MTPDKKNFKQLGEIAKQMINGKENYLLGAEKIIRLREELGIYANDPDFLAFIPVTLELNNFRKSNPEISLDTNQQFTSKEMLEAITWSKEISFSHCESLVKRYSE
ncbi:MAG: hypothetical protein ACRBCS_05345 [Cellvibrionaceae bacterium]